MALRLGVDLKLFDAAAGKNGGEISIEELAEATKADPLLVSKCWLFGGGERKMMLIETERIMRFLAAMGIFKEVTKGSYASTPLAESYVSSSPFSAVVIHVYVICIFRRLSYPMNQHPHINNAGLISS
jgi:hypothetical protein